MCVCLHIVLTMESIFTLHFVDPRDCTRGCQAGWQVPTCLGIFLEGSPASCDLDLAMTLVQRGHPIDLDFLCSLAVMSHSRFEVSSS